MRRHIFLLAFFLLFSIKPSTAHLTGTSAASVVPDFEKRSVIQSADIYLHKGGNETLGQVRAKALSKARRSILVGVRGYLDSALTIGEERLEYDIVKDGDGHPVRILQKKDLGLDERGRYHMQVTGEVRYTLRELIYESRIRSAALMKEGNPLTVKVWTDRKEYEEGDKIQVFVEGNRNFYGKVIRVDAEGKATQILPNNYRQISYFKKGKTCTVPDEGDRFIMEVTPPFGKERFVVFASGEPLSRRNMKTVAGGLYQYRGRFSSLERSVRASIPLSGEAMTEFYEGVWEISEFPRQ
ncbi:MAG: DUF4384 domain-containing protein [Thermodesulfobacteriota bacterium]|nr:DUF4384 domain-containing protein [Thermodesulfobacteriota bacterium]